MHSALITLSKGESLFLEMLSCSAIPTLMVKLCNAARFAGHATPHDQPCSLTKHKRMTTYTNRRVAALRTSTNMRWSTARALTSWQVVGEWWSFDRV